MRITILLDCRYIAIHSRRRHSNGHIKPGIYGATFPELSLTTAVCKSLFENNVMLETKHKALLAVILGTPGSQT
jgi:hypothetical protein